MLTKRPIPLFNGKTLIKNMEKKANVDNININEF